MLKNFFKPASKVGQRKSEPTLGKNIAERVKLKNEKIAELKQKKKTFKNC